MNERKGQRFIALCMLGLVLFNFPVLALFNVAGTVLGMPVLYAYLFAAWAAADRADGAARRADD